MNKNCPNCGKKKRIESQRELIIDFLAAITGRPEEYCKCASDSPKPEFWKANDLTEEQALRRGELAWRVWRMHHRPDMKDCVDLNYGYHITKDQRVICEATGDYYDITNDMV